jgi:hypothetical protein
LFGERIFGIGIYDLEHVTGALGTESQALIVDGDYSVAIFEYRSLFHGC